jgi:tetratricopeptide (TPR) repeat protein
MLALRELDKALQLNPELSVGYFVRGLVSLKRADLKDARESLLIAVRLQDDLFQAWMALSHVERELGDLGAALAAVERAIKHDPQHPAAHLTRAGVLQELGRTLEAASAYKLATRLNPLSKFAHFKLGSILVELGNTDEAEQQILKAHRLHPLDRASRIALGDLRLARGELDAAITDYKAAIDLDPAKAASVQGKLGEAYYRASLIQEAEVSLKTAIRRDPKQVPSILLLGRIYLQLGHAEEAVSLFESAVEIDSRYPEAQQLLEQALTAQRADQNSRQ